MFPYEIYAGAILSSILIREKLNMNIQTFALIPGGCPKINIPGFTYPVEEYYIEDIYETLRFVDLFLYLPGE